MTPGTCSREPELLAALRAGCSLPEELRSHLGACEDCREVAALAAALLEDGEAARAAKVETPLPGSGLVWFRLQTRARRESARSARRTLLLAQVFSVSIAGAIAMAMLQVLMPDWSTRVAAAFPAALRGVGPMLVAAVAWLALAGAPLAAYLATRED
jgi:predicted anti-sigma-YlaC factor YlaD